MTIIGAGLSPAGVTPGGVGVPVTTEAASEGGYEQGSAGAVSSLAIDTHTADYTYDGAGNETGMSDAGQRVYILLKNLKGSRANFPDDGFSPPVNAGSNVGKQVASDVEVALAPVIDDGTIQLLDVVTEVNGSTTVWAEVHWLDLRTGIARTTKA